MPPQWVELFAGLQAAGRIDRDLGADHADLELRIEILERANGLDVGTRLFSGARAKKVGSLPASDRLTVDFQPLPTDSGPEWREKHF